jgi:hypothetical protein
MAYHERMMLSSLGLAVAQIYVYIELNKDIYPCHSLLLLLLPRD